MSAVHCTGSFMSSLCSCDIRESPAQHEAQLWDKEAAYQQKYQLLHTAS